MKAFIVDRYKGKLRFGDMPDRRFGIMTCWSRSTPRV